MTRHIRYIGENHFPPFENEGKSHGWTGNRYGPIEATREQPADKTVYPPPEELRSRRAGAPTPTAPIDPWREARQHSDRLVAEAKK